MRVRKALTEENPLISVYDEKAWAELADSKTAPVEWSLDLLTNLHKRWVVMLEGLSEQHWQRSLCIRRAVRRQWRWRRCCTRGTRGIIWRIFGKEE